MGLEVSRQPRFVGGPELAVERADKQRIEFLIQHLTIPYTTRVRIERRSSKPAETRTWHLLRTGRESGGLEMPIQT